MLCITIWNASAETERTAMPRVPTRAGRRGVGTAFDCLVPAAYFFPWSASGIFVACQLTACHLPARFKNVPLFK